MDGLTYEVESLDGLDEPIQKLYTETEDGKYRLAIEGLPQPKEQDVSGLKKALANEREKAKAVTRWEKLGKTPEEIEELLQAQEKREEEARKKAGDFEAIRKQDAEKFKKREAALVAELEAAQASERSAIIGERLASALAKAGATEEGLDLLPDRLSGRIKIETEDGKRVIRIMTADGSTPLAGSNEDGTATFDDLAKSVATKYPSLFKSDRPGGGGTRPNPGGAGGANGKQMTRADFDRLSPGDRVKAAQSGVQVVD